MAFLQEYTMLDELGKGGFATVYKVRHNELGYIRAVRVLNETIVDADSATYKKFLRECKVLLRLGNGNHPNIVHIYQPRLLDNKALVEMDYVDGQDILHYLQQNQDFVSAEEVIRMAIQMSSALAYCHEDIYRFCMDRDSDSLQDDPNDGSKVLLDNITRLRLIAKYKVIHNDIHSGNIMRREDGNFVLLDFGLAINGCEVVRSSRHTNGAPEFKAPEKWDDESVLTEQSDIYSFGIVLYQYLSGRVPFPFNTSKSNKTEAEYLLSKAHQTEMPPPIEPLRKEFFERKYEGQKYQKDYPQWLEDVILKCLRKNPAERFKNGQELYEYIISQSQKSNRLYNDVEIERLTLENKDLASEVNDLRTTNHDLNNQLNSTQGNLYQTQQLLHETQSELDKIRGNSGKRTPKFLLFLLGTLILYSVGASYYAVLNNPIKLQQQIDEKNHIIDSKDAEIVELNKQIEDFSSSNDLSNVLNKKNIEIQNLKDEIARLNNNISNQNSTSNSSAEITHLNNEISRLNNQIAQKDQRIKQLENQSKQPSTNNSTEISRLNNLISQKDQQIKKLENTIAAKNREIQALQNN